MRLLQGSEDDIHEWGTEECTEHGGATKKEEGELGKCAMSLYVNMS